MSGNLCPGCGMSDCTPTCPAAVLAGMLARIEAEDGLAEARPDPQRGPKLELEEQLKEACARIAELLSAFGDRPKGERTVVTEVSRECAYNVARTDLADFYRTLGDDEEAGLVDRIFPELVLPAAEAEREALSRWAEARSDIEMPSAEGPF